MQLFFSPSSPYVRKVRVVAHELGLDKRIELVPTDPYDPAHPLHGKNPLGRVPTLITDEGQALFDSPVICEYLDHLAGGGRLYPAAGPARFAALLRQALGDGILDAAVPRRQEVLRPPAQQSPEWTERRKRNIRLALDELEGRVPELIAAGVDIGTVAIACALSYLDFRFAEDRWRDGRPKLAAWYASFAARPSMKATELKAPA
jgi:glutathione S-transferase